MSIEVPLTRDLHSAAERLVIQKRQDGNYQSFGGQGVARTFNEEVAHHRQGFEFEATVYGALGIPYDPESNSRQYLSGRPDLEIPYRNSDNALVCVRYAIRNTTPGFKRDHLIVRMGQDTRAHEQGVIGLLYGSPGLFVGVVLLRDLLQVARGYPDVGSRGGAPYKRILLDRIANITAPAEYFVACYKRLKLA